MCIRDSALILDIVKNHSASCFTKKGVEEKRLLWLGMKKHYNVWYDINMNGTLGNRLSYTNWLTTYNDEHHLGCAYMQSNGLWKEGLDSTCKIATMCTICKIEGEPVFTLKGICFVADMDWNYYITQNNRNEITYFDGYKDTKIIQTNDSSHRWEFASKNTCLKCMKQKLRQKVVHIINHLVEKCGI